MKKRVQTLARLQLAGGVPWGEMIVGRCSLFICQNCGGEFHVDAEHEPAAFCNDCAPEVLDRFAQQIRSRR